MLKIPGFCVSFFQCYSHLQRVLETCVILVALISSKPKPSRPCHHHLLKDHQEELYLVYLIHTDALLFLYKSVPH